MRLQFGTLCMLGLCASVSACTLGNASLVRRDQAGGVLALHGHQGEAREDAERQMAAHCGGPYTVVSEEYVPVGQTTYSDTEGHRRGYSSQTTTTDVTEYRITYQCGVVGPAPQGGAYPAQPQPQGAPPAAQPAPAAPAPGAPPPR